jgi:hypothetical protein
MGNIEKFAQQMQIKDYCYVNELAPLNLREDYYSVETKDGDIKTVVFCSENVLQVVDKVEKLQSTGKISDCWIVFESLLLGETVEAIRERFSVWCEQRIIPIFDVKENEKFYSFLIQKEVDDAESNPDLAWL